MCIELYTSSSYSLILSGLISFPPRSHLSILQSTLSIWVLRLASIFTFTVSFASVHRWWYCLKSSMTGISSCSACHLPLSHIMWGWGFILIWYPWCRWMGGCTNCQRVRLLEVLACFQVNHMQVYPAARLFVSKLSSARAASHHSLHAPLSTQTLFLAPLQKHLSSLSLSVSELTTHSHANLNSSVSDCKIPNLSHILDTITTFDSHPFLKLNSPPNFEALKINCQCEFACS